MRCKIEQAEVTIVTIPADLNEVTIIAEKATIKVIDRRPGRALAIRELEQHLP